MFRLLKLGALLFLFGALCFAAERPNILWITSEDNSAHWIGCYGNEMAQTPNIDGLAKRGVRYKYAYSNSPVCAVARSTIIMGRYASTMGTQNMRSRYPIPDDMLSYAELFGKAGYQTSNIQKTDYNMRGNDKSHWNSKSKSPWNAKNPEKPFLHVVNFKTSHESSLFDKSKTRSSSKRRVNPSSVNLPPYLPKTKELKDDWALYHDIITKLDREVGKVLLSLKQSEQADNTIIFYYSDHGGIHPRSKRFLFDTGTRVPLIVYLPEKWKHLSPLKAGSVSEQVVSFVDLAQTILKIANIEHQDDMQGQAFLGSDNKQREYAFLYGQRYDEQVFKFVRGVTNGKYRYVRNFYPHYDRGIHSGYPYSQPGWRSYKSLLDSNGLDETQSFIWKPQPVEELYHVENDQWEIKNIADDPGQTKRLQAMRKAVKSEMIVGRDTGIIPEIFYGGITAKTTVYDYIRDSAFPFKTVFDLAWGDGINEADIVEKMKHAHPCVRFWAVMNLSRSIKLAQKHEKALIAAKDDESLEVRFAVAEVLHGIGKKEFSQQQTLDILEKSKDEILMIRCLNLASKNGLKAKTDSAKWNEFCGIAGHYGKRLKK